MKLKSLLTIILFANFLTVKGYADLKPILDAQIGQSVINIPYGTYEFSSSSSTHYSFTGLNNVTVNGNGSTVICKTAARAFNVTSCENFTIRDLTIDYDPLCYTQGTITNVSADSKQWTVRLHGGYARYNIAQSKLMLFDPVTLGIKKNLFTIQSGDYSFSQNPNDSAEVSITITRSMTAGSIQVGEHVVMSLNLASGKDQHTMFVNLCKNFTAQNLTIYGSNMFSIIEHDCENSKYLKVKITRNPNDPTKSFPRLRAGNADGIHSKHAVVGPTIDSCTVEYNGDDCIAVNGRFYPVYKVDATNQYVYVLSRDTNGEVRIQPNDSVICVDNNGSIKATVAANELVVETPTTNERTVCTAKFSALISPTAFIFGKRIKINSWPASGINIGDYVYSENRIGAGFKITNNHVGHTRARGILIKSSNGIISNNIVEGTQLAGIVLAPEVNWMEAGCSNNVEISNNTIKNCVFASTHAGMVQPAALCIISLNAANQISPQGAANNLNIFNNRIETCPRPAVVATSISGLNYHHNTIVDNQSVVRAHGTTFGVQNNVDLWLRNTGNIDSVTTINVTESTVEPLIGMFESAGRDTITVSGKNLGSTISITVNGNDAQLFSVSPSTIIPIGGLVSDVPVIITYLPTATGTHTATLHLNSDNAAEVTRSLNGSLNLSDQIGKPLQSWKKGQMDIYQINTGRGENYYLIYPDSTSMLIDAGDINVDQYSNPPRPDNTRSAGEWVSRFISNVNPKQNNIDYLLNSHFHSDHFGSYLVTNSVLSTDKGSLNYKPTGISRVGDFISIGKLVDRGYPDYNKPQNIANYQDIANYRKFVSWKVQTTSMQAEQFEIGSNSQFVLKHQPTDYPTFKIQNLFGNGKVWTGSGEHVIDYVAKNATNLTAIIDDNILSCGIKVNYGNFTYYTGGDLIGTLKDENDVAVSMDGAVKNIIGEVDLCKANHHCFTGSNSTEFVNALSPKVYFLSYINSKHLKTPVLSNLIANPKNGTSCLLAPTYLSDAQRTSLMSETYYNQFTETGHIVVRVFNGGDKYLLYVLNDTDELKTVKAVYGPFTSKAPKNTYIDANHANANDANIGSDPNAPWKTLKTSSWNNLEDGSVINIAAGTYTWSTVSITKNLTVQGSSKDQVILQGMSDANFDSKTGNNDKLATIDATTVTFKKMTLRNSILKSGANGGFFYISKDKTLNLEDMILERSYGVLRYGGAIASKGGLNCTDVTFDNNIAMQGGALFVELESGYYNFKGCKFTNNSTNEGSLGATNYKIGGAIYVNNASGKFNNMNFDQCLFDSNESYDNSNGVGGALSMRVNVAGGQLNTTINKSAFINNKTYGLGSAIYTTATGTATSTSKFALDIKNTSFINNQNHQSGAKSGTTISIFTNSGYNSTAQKGIFYLTNNTFYNNTNGNTGNRSIYIPDPKLDINLINNLFLDSPDEIAYSLFVQGPTDNIPVYSTLAGRGNIGDRMGGSLFTTNYTGYNWALSSQGNLANVDNNGALLNTTPQFNSYGVPFLAISSSSSVLIDAGFSVHDVNVVNIVPQVDIEGKPIIGTKKDVGVYEKEMGPMGITTNFICNNEFGSCVSVYRNKNNRISIEFKSELSEQVKVSVYDAIGQKIFENRIKESVTELNSNFQSGIYIVFLYYGSNKTSKKVMIY